MKGQGGDDCRLAGNSPCIDAGTTQTWWTGTTDLGGKVRIQDGDGNGTARVDMGAYDSVTLTVEP